jgi:hypothetical protein
MWIYTKGDDEKHGAIIWLVALVDISTYRVVDVAGAVRCGRRPPAGAPAAKSSTVRSPISR